MAHSNHLEIFLHNTGPESQLRRVTQSGGRKGLGIAQKILDDSKWPVRLSSFGTVMWLASLGPIYKVCVPRSHPQRFPYNWSKPVSQDLKGSLVTVMYSQA